MLGYMDHPSKSTNNGNSIELTTTKETKVQMTKESPVKRTVSFDEAELGEPPIIRRDFYKNPKPSSALVIDIDEDSSERFDLKRVGSRKNSFLTTKSITPAAGTTTKRASPSPLVVKTTSEQKSPRSPTRSGSFKKEPSSQSAPKTIVTLEDDEVPETPYLTTILGRNLFEQNTETGDDEIDLKKKDKSDNV